MAWCRLPMLASRFGHVLNGGRVGALRSLRLGARALCSPSAPPVAAAAATEEASRLQMLSVGQLRSSLEAAGVSCAGSTEKAELIELLRRARTSAPAASAVAPGVGAASGGLGGVGQQSSFRATSEWQAVPEGTILEPGCEVRLDMGSGAQHVRLAMGQQHKGQQPQQTKERHRASSSSAHVPLEDAAAAGVERPRIEWGWKVLVSEDAAEVRRSLRRLWDPDMEAYCGQVGTVTHVSEEGPVTVEFGGSTWVSWAFTPEVLRRVG
eukprot:CAMPEP_0204131922 /NCGR_PEP_ID=MMETSP0361-20130328/14227_1 /ASSEMBLY_ACC=CAM_ASM_000343 /TAXON_ID=268821 /ORGANISM="Scrippsiella Hangoei, Strain SHTV-5" /LENGTH=265 /DNA_ID=CAMNT_0051084749 /DNA_START=44 /DNA_END=841 /DNA_ORIENTATION=+